MKQTTYTVRVIEATEGNKLTQSKDVEIVDRIISEKIYLSINDDAKNWKEISDNEAELLQIKQREIAKQ